MGNDVSAAIDGVSGNGTGTGSAWAGAEGTASSMSGTGVGSGAGNASEGMAVMLAGGSALGDIEACCGLGFGLSFGFVCACG
jgi:hypothetical protein